MRKSAAAIFLGFYCVSTHALAQEAEVETYFEALRGGDRDAILQSGDVLLNWGPGAEWYEPEDFYDLLLEISAQRAEAEETDKAIEGYNKALDFGVAVFGDSDLRLRRALRPLGVLLAAKGDVESAEATLLKSLGIAEAELGAGNPSLREELDLLAQLPIEPVDDPHRPDGGDRAGSYRVREALIGQSAQLQRRELVTLGADDPAAVDHCVAADGSVVENAFQRLEIYYATNRGLSGKTTPAKFFKNNWDQSVDVRYGSVYVTVPCKRDLGAIPKAKWWKGSFRPNKAKHVVLEDVRLIDEKDDFWTDVAAAVNESSRKEILVFIHGFNTDFEGAALRTAQLAADLELDGAPMFYDWPSRAGMSPFAYNADREVATGEPMKNRTAEFLFEVATRAGADKIHIVAHSMGNEPLLRALEELEDNQFRDASAPPFTEVVFASADVAAANFKELVRNTSRLAQRMTLYASSKDKALGISAIMSKFQRAGDADEKLVLSGLDSIDTTKASKGFIGHNDFAGNGLDDLRSVVWHSLPPESQCVLKGETVDDGERWIFEPACEDRVFQAAIILVRRFGPEQARLVADSQIAQFENAGDADEEARWRAVRSEIGRY